jgi:hypothetical protein
MNYQKRKRWLTRIADGLGSIPFALEIGIAVASIGGVVAMLWLW